MITRVKAHVVFWATLLAGVAADLLSKHFVFSWLSGREGRVFDLWPGVFRLSLHHNSGGPFSLLQGHRALLIGFAFAALCVVVYLYLGAARKGMRLSLVGLAMVAAGAIGNNLFDRLALGAVRDFLDFYLIHYPVFNVADVLICVGAGLLILEMLRSGRGEPGSGRSAA